MATLLFASGFSNAFATEKIYALVIGIGDYLDERIDDIPYARVDAEAVSAYLSDKSRGGVAPENLWLLLDGQATTINIRKAMSTLHQTVTPFDTVIIYFSGHGAPERDRAISHVDGFTKYMVTADSDRENLYATAIPMDEIEGHFLSIDAKCLVFIMDSCYSGARGGRTINAVSGTVRDLGVTEVFTKSMDQGKGRAVISASKANEVAMDYPEKGHGLFTYFFLEAVSGAADDDQDQQVTLHEAFDYIQNRVIPVAKVLGGNQHPQLRSEITEGDIVLASAQGIGAVQPPDPFVFFRKSKYQPAKWTSLALTVGAAAASAGFFITGDNHYNSWKKAEDPSEKNRLKKDVEDYYLYGQISAGVAAASGAATLVFFLIDHRQTPSKTSSHLRFVPSIPTSGSGIVLGVATQW